MRFTIALGCALAMASPAFAGFEVEGSETEENSVEFEIINSVAIGDVGEEDTRSQHEIAVSWGVLSGWTSGLALEFEKEFDEGLELDGFEWFNTIGLIGGETGIDAGSFSAALFTAFEFEFDESSDVELTVGPAFGMELGPAEVNLNTFVSVPLGGGEPAGFSYAAGVMHEVMDEIEVGIEFHGSIESAFDNAADLSDQEHFVGPVAEFEFEVEDDREVGLHVGALFGLTDATSTVALIANIELEF